MMETNHAIPRVHAPNRSLWRLPVLVLPCILFLAPPVESAPPQRPQVAPGGNNWKPPTGFRPRALVTQDLNTPGLTPAGLVTALLGAGVTPTNVTFTGANGAAGTFTGGTGIVGFASGIVLSSGGVAFVPGPNTQDDFSVDNAQPGDAALDGLIPGYTTFDACVLEFDFTCSGAQVIQFQYVLTSEEYNEWVNSPFNDVFGFFLNGVNIALVPGGGLTPVSINNVNCDNPFNPPLGSFCNLFVNNRCADIPPGTFPCAGVRDTQMDALTVVLTATATLIPGVNHIKLAVADAGDPVLDSNVFIQGQSFTCGVPTGACCNTAALTCIDNVPQANCLGANEVWSVGLACGQLNPPCTNVIHPGGTDCGNPIPITSIPFIDVNTTDNKNNDYSSTCLGTFDNGNDILYTFTITGTRCVDITVIGATPQDDWIGVVLDNVCPPSTACLAQATTSGSVATISNQSLPPGTYYLMIDRWPLADDSLSFTLLITDCGAPAGACCDTVAHTCIDNVVQANCQGANEVWSVGVACSQLNPPCAAITPPTGRNCNDPIPITSLPYLNVNTTDKDNDYADTCLGVYDDGNDILYKLTITSPRCVDITVTGATPADDLIGIALDSACPPSNLSCLAQATTTGSVATISHQPLPPGTYYLMVDRWPLVDNSMNFTLSITDCPYAKGDVNCDHAVNTADIPQFIAALIGGYTGCDITLADMNDSGSADGEDIQPFVNAVLVP